MNRLFTKTLSTKPIRSSALQNAWYHATKNQPEAMPVSAPATICKTTSIAVSPEENGMMNVPMPAQAASAKMTTRFSNSSSNRLVRTSAGTSETAHTPSDISYTLTDEFSGNSCGAKKHSVSQS